MQPVYLISANSLPKFLEAIRHAQTPEKLTLRFLEELGFKSTNDRLLMTLLKAMKFVDEGGKPTARYHAFLDDTQWKRVLADGIRDAYPDLFRINRNAHTLPREQVTGKVKSLTEGKASEAILTNTVKTFLELVKLADFSAASNTESEEKPVEKEVDMGGGASDAPAGAKDTTETAGTHATTTLNFGGAVSEGPRLVYRIEIVLPAVRDQSVYDAIFQSVRAHLLR
jgi:hypothetical protein